MIDKQNLIQTFLDLVQIDSPSGREEKVRDYIEGYLSGLGIDCKKDKYGNLIGKITGIGKLIVLSAHMDTVQPGEGVKPVVKGDIIKSDGRTILGADDKAGVTEILETVRYFVRNKIGHRPLELVFSREEEAGLVGAFNLDFSKLKSKEALVIDKAKKPMAICLASPFIDVIDIELTGRTAHAGNEPEKGINAVVVASRAIGAIKWGRLDEETTCNIGQISGGQSRNSVADFAGIKAEARCHDRKKLARLTKSIKQTFEKEAKKSGAKLKFNSRTACPGYKFSPRDSFIAGLAKTANKLKLPVYYEKSGGGSDANVFAGQGFKVADISCGGEGCHTRQERIKISDMIKICGFLVEYLRNE